MFLWNFENKNISIAVVFVHLNRFPTVAAGELRTSRSLSGFVVGAVADEVISVEAGFAEEAPFGAGLSYHEWKDYGERPPDLRDLVQPKCCWKGSQWKRDHWQQNDGVELDRTAGCLTRMHLRQSGRR